MRAPRRLALALAFVAVLSAACSRAPQDPVERLLAALEAAVEARDAAAFVEQLTPDFRAHGTLDRASAGAELRRWFALYEKVSVERAPADVTRDGAATLVTVRVIFSAKPKLEGRFGLAASESSPIRFELRCREHEGALRVTDVAWAEEAPPVAPPQ